MRSTHTRREEVMKVKRSKGWSNVLRGEEARRGRMKGFVWREAACVSCDGANGEGEDLEADMLTVQGERPFALQYIYILFRPISRKDIVITAFPT